MISQADYRTAERQWTKNRVIGRVTSLSKRARPVSDIPTTQQLNTLSRELRFSHPANTHPVVIPFCLATVEIRLTAVREISHSKDKSPSERKNRRFQEDDLPE
jgi:hypothetical protein